MTLDPDSDTYPEDLNRVKGKIDRSSKFIELSLLCVCIACLLLVGLVWYTIVRDREKESRAECRDKFTGQIVDAQADYFSSLGELLLVSFAVRNNEEARDVLEVQITKAKEAAANYRAAVDARHEFDEKGRPLPCSLP